MTVDDLLLLLFAIMLCGLAVEYSFLLVLIRNIGLIHLRNLFSLQGLLFCRVNQRNCKRCAYSFHPC